MKKAIVLLLLPLCFHAKAQNADENKDAKKGFPKDKLFTGGSLNLGFGGGVTQLGIAPQFGYSITSWADVGVNFSVNYISQRDYYSYGDKLRQTTYGPGAFIRLFPINFLFATTQYEYNFIHLKYIPVPNSGSTSQVNNENASSLLVGGGYAGGRQRGSNTYYFISIMWDVLGAKNSPYVDGLGRSYPVIRAGYNIGLFQNRYQRSNNEYYNKNNGDYYNR